MNETTKFTQMMQTKEFRNFMSEFTGLPVYQLTKERCHESETFLICIAYAFEAGMKVFQLTEEHD